MKSLSCIFSEEGSFHSKSSVEVSSTITRVASGCKIIIEFTVKQRQPWVINNEWPKDRSQWGLWENDVVEVFIQPTLIGEPVSQQGTNGGSSPDQNELPYYEFQLSPLGQFFELEVFEPRKRWNEMFQSGFVTSTKLFSSPQVWRSTFEFDAQIWRPGQPSKKGTRQGSNEAPAPLAPVEEWLGGAFAILGPSGSRSYWALFLDGVQPPDRPDFHIPRRFRRLHGW